MTSVHSHRFVETYSGLVGFGLDRETDENTLRYYLQKFSDDELMENLLPRLTEPEMEEVFSLVNRLMKRHFAEAEYHRLFLKSRPTGGEP